MEKNSQIKTRQMPFMKQIAKFSSRQYFPLYGILRLGGFHTEMSFLGCIRHLMASSGLQEMLELIYAPNAVVHMLSGKAIIAQAIHAHFIVDAALNALMLKSVFNAPLPDKSDGNENEDPDMAEIAARPPDEQSADVGKNLDLDEACTLYMKLMPGEICAEEVCMSDVLKRIKDSLQKHSETRTSALWVQYMNIIDILRKYIRGERTGNWALHLQAMQDMLPYMAASGHNLYTKSVRVYLQEMSNLKAEHPDVQQCFDEGFHVIRRSNRLWAGLSSAL